MNASETMEAATVKSLDTAASGLRARSMAVRLRKQSIGKRKALTASQHVVTAEQFNAAADYVSARKKLFDTSHPAMRQIDAVISAARAFWKANSLPFPEDGVRLISRDTLPAFEAAMAQFVDQLADAVAEADAVYETEILPAASVNLGELFDRNDYPNSLFGQFALSWEYPSVEPPEYLAQLAPEIYEMERQRVAARFEEAVRQTEEMLAAQLADLVASLVERLTPQTVTLYQYTPDTQARLEAFQVGEDFSRLWSAIQTATDIEQKGARVVAWNANEKKGAKTRHKFASDAEASEWLTAAGCVVVGSRRDAKQFKGASVENFAEFFDTFKRLDVNSSEALAALVDQAKAAMGGVDPDALRTSEAARETVRESLAEISERLDAFVVDRPKRAISLVDIDE